MDRQRRFRFIFRHGRRVKVLARGRSRRVFVRAVSAIPEHIVGGTRLPAVSKTTDCGSNCMNVMTTTVDAMTLKSRSTLATINAGGNMSLNADNITNQYSLISAGGNIHLAAKVADNLPVNILSVTTVSTVMSRNQRYCKGVDLFGICVGGHGNRMIYSGTKVSTSKQVSNTVAATIQAGGSITGNVANLTNGNIRSNQTIAAPIAQTASTATAANSHTTKTVAVNGGNIPAVTAASLALLEQPVISLPKGQLGLFIVSPDPTSQYLIETNPAFTVYNNFISSNLYVAAHQLLA